MLLIKYDFINGSLAVDNAESILPKCRDLIRNFNWNLIVVSQDFHPSNHISFSSTHPSTKPFTTIKLNNDNQDLWPDHCVQYTKGSEIHESILNDLNNQTNVVYIKKGTDVNKDAYSAFDSSTLNLLNLLTSQNIENIYIGGLAADFCVLSTSIDALKSKKFKSVSLIEDATKPVNANSNEWRSKILSNGGSITYSHQL